MAMMTVAEECDDIVGDSDLFTSIISEYKAASNKGSVMKQESTEQTVANHIMWIITATGEECADLVGKK